VELHRSVLEWYVTHQRDLPWRRPDRTPWGVLVSEIMLQQTPVSRVEPVWQEWMARWPDPADLAAASPAEVIRAWGRLGYPRRALRLQATAVALVERHGGQVPADLDDLLALPGIGHYTAAAVASFAFGRRHPVLDSNVRRVLGRLIDGIEYPSPAPTVAERRQAERLLPTKPQTAATWAVAVMELGALICTARSPRCTDCPVADRCRWLATGSPRHTGPARRGQPWTGTDRQVRGRIMAVLREADTPVSRARLVAAVPDPGLRDGAQRDRCLHGLVTDGLVEPLPGNRFALPGSR
jgi:A/G-specific adenine glycosylase